MKINKEVKIGIYLVVTIVLLYWGINFLSGKDIFGSSHKYYTEFNDVQGLQQTSHVYIRGLKIGTVEGIEFDEKNSSFLVTLSVDSKYNIPVDSKAIIYSMDLLGSKAIKIELGKSSGMLTGGERLPSGVEADLGMFISAELPSIKEKLSKLLDQANETFGSVNNVLNKETTDNLNKLVANLSDASANLKSLSRTVDVLLTQEKQPIANLLSNLEQVSKNLKDNDKNISALLTNLANISDSLAKADLGGLASDLNQIVKKINSGEGTMGKLVTNDSLYFHLNNATNSLDALLKDLKENPKRYVNISVFGKSGSK